MRCIFLGAIAAALERDDFIALEAYCSSMGLFEKPVPTPLSKRGAGFFRIMLH